MSDLHPEYEMMENGDRMGPPKQPLAGVVEKVPEKVNPPPTPP